MSRSYRKRIPVLSLSAKNKKKWKRISHKTIRSRVRDTINKGEYELLYDETVGKSFPMVLQKPKLRKCLANDGLEVTLW